MEGKRVFALDIGTRSVVGLIAIKKEDDSLEILDVEVAEHPERSMIGGQIHDVPRVAKIVSHIKKTLEMRLGLQLKEVAVAAAGRSLLTTYGRSEMTFPFPQEITEELFHALQLEAVQAAQRQIQEVNKSYNYHCVGFSIYHQYLDELPIGNLVGQIGNQVAIEIIATFLPRIVIDSLHGALQKADLEMNYITLEPIAAMNLAVPDNMRQLNVVLVDIGAGTSDIAISDKGTIQGYAMIPTAGDQITEALCQAYLLDFSTGENVKQQLQSTAEYVSFKDITGTTHSYSKEEVLLTIVDSVAELANNIAQRIKEVNGRPPQVVLCIGGGSLTPTLTEHLARALDLPENRVAIIGQEVTAPVTKLTNKLTSPQAVTPLAIGTDALYHRILDILSVKVNGRPIRLFATDQATVGDALISAGISPSQYFGRIGPALSLEVNGEVFFIKGQPGQLGKITINNQDGDLTTPIQEGDSIVFTPGTTGSSGEGVIEDVLPSHLVRTQIKLNGLLTPLLSQIRLNGKQVSNLKLPVSDNCRIDFVALTCVMDVLKHFNYDFLEVPTILLNGTPCQNLQQPLMPGDDVEIFDVATQTVQEVQETRYLQVQVNGRPIEVPMPTENTSVILTDIFQVVNFDPQQGRGKRLIMEVNGETANFITPLKAGDIIEIKWV